MAKRKKPKPVKRAPAKPVKRAPAKPVKRAPAKPVKRTPAKPVKRTPAKPVKRTPAKPVKRAPAKPVKRTPAKPVKRAPAKPVKRAPAKPVKRAPRRPVKAPARPAQPRHILDMGEWLRFALERLAGETGGHFRVHENRDGSIDGELRISADIPAEAIDIVEADFPLVDQFWISAGWLYTAVGAKPETPQVTFRGKDAAFTYPRLGRYKGDVFDYARVILRQLQEMPATGKQRKGRKLIGTAVIFDKFVIRLRWSEDGSRPNWHTRS